MSRYKVSSPWTVDTYDRQPILDENTGTIVAIQTADIVDTKNGTTYERGAYRVATCPVNGNGSADLTDLKAYKTGKGGTVPHYGESAWCAAVRDFDDLTTKLRFA